ncbi:hypothetical protein SK128_017215 [Halocaridina rubra]|uniref:Uncharacterized protein n=1 Tax=Halocaridina rubra TaxID=373956 RepID=A0AAN8WSQ9_HALRR
MPYLDLPPCLFYDKQISEKTGLLDFRASKPVVGPYGSLNMYLHTFCPYQYVLRVDEFSEHTTVGAVEHPNVHLLRQGKDVRIS